jgi:hypothetical protein
VRFASRLTGATAGQVAVWLVVATPALFFVAIPAAVVLVWLALFWVVELVFFLVLKPFSRRPVNKPRLQLKMS